MILAFLLAGCASTLERKAFQEYKETNSASYGDFEQEKSGRKLPELDEKSNLSDYLAYAALNNPGLEAAFNRWKAALEKVPQVRSLPDPKFNYGYFIEEVETRVGPQRQKMELSQMFPWLPKLKLRGDIALESANAAREQYEAVKLRLFYRVKNAYCEYYYVGQAIAITKENMDLMTYLESVVRMRYNAGIAPYSAIIQAQVELGTLEDGLRTFRDFLNPVLAMFNAALNRPPDAPLPLPKSIPEESVDFSNDQLLSWLREINPELKALDFMIAKEKAAITLARQDYFPDIMVGVSRVDTDEALMPNVEESGKDSSMAMVGLSLPIWHNKYGAEVREAKARHVAAVNQRDEQENRLIADLKMVLFKFRDAERKIDLYRDALIPKAKQSLEVTQQEFEAGTLEFLNLIDAERVLLAFNLLYERALSNYGQRLAELEVLTGREIPRSDENRK